MLLSAFRLVLASLIQVEACQNNLQRLSSTLSKLQVRLMKSVHSKPVNCGHNSALLTAERGIKLGMQA